MSSGEEDGRNESEDEGEFMDEPGMGPEDEDEIDQDDFDLFVMAMETGSLHKLSSVPLRSTPQPQLYSPLTPASSTPQKTPLEISLSKYQDTEGFGAKRIRGGDGEDEDKPEEFPSTETAQRPHTFDSPSNARNSKSVSTKTVFVDISEENDIDHEGVKSHSCPDLRTTFLDLTEEDEPAIHERPKKRRKLDESNHSDDDEEDDEKQHRERTTPSSRTPDQNSRSRYYADQGPGSDSQKNKKRRIENCILCGSESHVQYKCPERRCSSCGGVGHLKRECPVSHLQECFRCGKKGHLAAKCKVSSRELSDPTAYRLKTSTSLIGEGTGRRYCFNCGQKGHTAKNCDDYPIEEYIMYQKRHGEFSSGGRRKRRY